MTARLTLSGKIVLLAAVNLLLLAAIFLAFAHYQFHVELGTFLFAPARDRVEAVAGEIAILLDQTPVSGRTALLGRYAATYKVDFYLFENQGEQLAGRRVELPPEVRGRLLGGPAESAPGAQRPPPPLLPEDDSKGPPPPRRFRFDDKGPDDGKGPPPEVREAEDEAVDFPPPPARVRPGPPPPRRRGAGPDGKRTDPVRAARSLTMFQVSGGGLFWVGVRIPVGDPDGPRQRGTLLLAAPSFYGTPLFFDFIPWLVAMCAVVGVLALCWLPFVRSLTRTISGITRATELISRGNFDRHLPGTRDDELGQLSGAINRMADRLSGFVTGQKRFLGDIAHELCAPIARIEFGVGILEQRAAEADLAAVADVRDEIRQMSALVGELLLFSKAGMEPQSRPLLAVPVAGILAAAVDRESAEARHAGTEVIVSCEPDLAALADSEYLIRAVSNLVRNAIRYAGQSGPVTVGARREGGEIVVTVSDCGPGLPPAELERIFAPFYRLEPSRNRASGGAGLGLAIVKSCVEACQGRVLCRNRTPTGLEVELRLKAA